MVANAENKFSVQALLDRTKYSLDVTTGQRRYGGPPPTEVYDGEEPGPGCQVGLISCIDSVLYCKAVLYR